MTTFLTPRICALVVFALVTVTVVKGQAGSQSVYGDINVDESKAAGLKPISLDLILYSTGGIVVSRQSVPSNGRYRFNNLSTGFYELVVEVEGREIARLRIDLSSPLLADRRQDISLEWKGTDSTKNKPAIISAADKYERDPANSKLFEKANEATDKKHYEEAADLLLTLLKSDPKDFQAWTELANVHLLDGKYPEAETEYLRAIDLHPNFLPALINLGRLEIAQQKNDVAIEVLGRALKSHPESAEANRLLGECYLQVKKGSLAVGYLNEALRLDPERMAEVHLRLALLYNGAGMKDKAVLEYEAFLKKRPDYAERKKLEKYIAENKKR
jgi:tetratricopeptide (TPR) repeat protein